MVIIIKVSVNAFLYSLILYNVLNIHFRAEASFTKLIQREQNVEIIKYCCEILDDAKFFCPSIKFLSKLKNNYIFALNCGISICCCWCFFFAVAPSLSFNQIFSVCHFNLLLMKNHVDVFNAFSKYIRKWAHLFSYFLVCLTKHSSNCNLFSSTQYTGNICSVGKDSVCAFFLPENTFTSRDWIST